MDTLSPNTSALLSYLSADDMTSFSFDDLLADPTPKISQGYTNPNPTSLPPSAFFNMPVPGRDTPELTPESSSNAASESPEGLRAVMHTDSEEDAVMARRASAGAGAGGRKGSEAAVVNKRKAGHGHTVQEHDDEDEDSGSDDPNGHEDKRAHGNDKAAGGAAGSGRRGGRKSTGGAAGDAGSKEMSKAEKRKVQNRQAQEAFRKRREAKVKDLEDKVNELETKSYSTTVENENLRGLLKRLQEENVALKQAAFTFTMPVSGAATPTTHGRTSVPAPNTQASKPPTPPHDELRSIHDVPDLVHRSSSGSGSGMVESPESLVSVNSSASGSSKLSFDNAEMLNAFAMGVRPEWSRDLAANQQITAAALGGREVPQPRVSPGIADPFANFTGPTPSVSPVSSASNAKDEVDALWASFYPNGTSNILPKPQQDLPVPNYAFGRPTAAPSFGQSGDQFAGPQTVPSPFGGSTWVNAPADRMAFRDQSAPASAGQPGQVQPQQDWSNINDDSINEFLASLNGTSEAPQEPLYDFEQTDDFNAQLQKLLEQSGGGASPSAAFTLSPTGFSPTAYLNLTPSPAASGSASASGSGSNAHSPAAARQASTSSMSMSNSASPESTGSTAASSYTHHSPGQAAGAASGSLPGCTTKMAGANPGEVVHVVGADGKRLKPSELWVLMGMNKTASVDNLMIDDLCDQMKSKAVCTDGGYTIGLTDAEQIFAYNKRLGSARTAAGGAPVYPI